MIIKGTNKITLKKFSFLSIFGLSNVEAAQLKRLGELEIDSNKADALLQNGFAEVVKVDEVPEKKTKSKKSSEPVDKDDADTINNITKETE